MSKPKPAAAGHTTMSAATQLVQAETELAQVDLMPEERAEAEAHLDELRNAARLQAGGERHAQLAEQELANYARAHGEPDAEPETAPAAVPATPTDTAGE